MRLERRLVAPRWLAFAVPAFRIGGVEIWGATAMVLAEFLAMLGWPDHLSA